MSAKELTFIASGGRAGTQFFGDMSGEVIGDCHPGHEPDLFAGVSRLMLERSARFGLWHMVLGRLLGQTGVRGIADTLDRAAAGRLDLPAVWLPRDRP